MELRGEQLIDLPREAVWQALNDPAILKQCIPGCDSFESSGENMYRVIMTAAVGPIKAKFTGKLSLSDIKPPSSYALSFDGSGGAAGFGKGNAGVELTATPNGTQLSYTVNAHVSGRLAQVGARLIDSVAKKMADEFFSRFKSVLIAADGPSAAADAASTGSGTQPQVKQVSAAAPASSKSRAAVWAWTAAAAAVVITTLVLVLR